MKRLVSEVLAVPPNALLDETEYSNVAQQLTGHNWPDRWFRYGPGPFWKDWALAWEHRESELLSELKSNERPVTVFAQHSISLLLSGERTMGPYWFGLPLPPEEFRKDLAVEADETAFTTALACLGARLQRSQRIADFTQNVLTYDLPSGSSPRATSDSLLKLLDSGKKMCLAPMAAGGTLGVAQLTQGQYIPAILTVSTGSVMTLILLGSVAVGSLLVARVAQRRDHQVEKQ
jgi:hypothetical protein